MNRKIIMLILCAAFLSLSSVTGFAQNNKNEKNMEMTQDVYVTKNGKKYHKSDCPFVQNRNPEKFSKKDARSKGLSPCPKCFKEDLPPEEKKTGSIK